MEPFTGKWLCHCSRSWIFGGRNQSGRGDLLIHPFGPGSSSHLQRAVLWTLLPQANSYSQIVPLQSTGLFMWAQCDPGAMFSLAIIKAYSVATHRTKLICLSHWWTATTDPAALPVPSEHPRARGTQAWADVILLPGTLPQLFHKAATRVRGRDQAFSLESFLQLDISKGLELMNSH